MRAWGAILATTALATCAVPAAADPIQDGKKWTNAGDYVVYGPKGNALGKTPPVYNYASPAAVRTATVAADSKLAAGIGRAGRLVYDDFAIIGGAERANAKSAAFLKSAAGIIGGGVAAGTGKWGSALAASSKFLRPVGKAVNWLGYGLMAYSLFNLAFGSDGDEIRQDDASASSGADAEGPPVSYDLAKMVLTDSLIPNAAYPLITIEEQMIGQVGVLNVLGRRMIFAMQDTAYTYPGFYYITYTQVPASTPGVYSGYYYLQPWSFGGMSGRTWPVCDVKDMGTIRVRRCAMIVDSFPGMNQNSWVTTGCPLGYSNDCDQVKNPPRKVYVGGAFASPSGLNHPANTVKPDSVPAGAENEPLRPEALEPIIRKALADAGITADDAAVARYSQEAVRDVKADELTKTITPEAATGLVRTPGASPLYQYVPAAVQNTAPDADHPKTDTETGTETGTGGNTGTGTSGKTDQTVETDDPDEDSGFKLPTIQVQGFVAGDEACPTWPITFAKKTYTIDPGCTYFDRYSTFLRGVAFVGAVMLGLFGFRGR